MSDITPTAAVRTELTDAGREQIKLRATMMNNGAVATYSVGCLGSLVKAFADPPATTGETLPLVFLAFVCFGLAGVLHFHAYRHLKELDQ